MKQKLTIKQIAKLASVSPGTVDRVLHKRGDVSQQTKKRIEEVLSNTEYIPNSHARNLAKNKILTIGVLLPKYDTNEYWNYIMQGINKFEQDSVSLGVQIKAYHYDQNNKISFEKTSQKLINDRVDAILLAKVLHKPTIEFVKKCRILKIPFVIVGTNEKVQGALNTIGQNSYQSGRLAAQLLSYENIKSPNFIILNIRNAKNKNFNVKQRIKGFKEYFLDHPDKNVSIRKIQFSLGDNKIMTDLLKKEINSTKQLTGIFVPNSKSYILEEVLTSEKNVRVVGYDLLEKNVQLLKNGKVDFLIHQRPYEQGYNGLEIIYRFLAIKTIKPEITSLPLDIVTKENFMFY